MRLKWFIGYNVITSNFFNNLNKFIFNYLTITMVYYQFKMKFY
ncbi:hypothetical protein C8C84_2388 [Flavobacterium sp. 102]|nr:hypothetical protein C8C84_2388 [Flavobacterium sp. 102]